MSDFDKEAEREKLREKYEQDKQKRDATEQMSELLLKGATMTNAHCSQCGDPIFRYDGQEFCPTCEKAVDRDAGDDAGGSGSIEVTDPSEETRVSFGGSADAAPAEDDSAAAASESVQERQPTEAHRRQTGGEEATQAGSDAARDAQPADAPQHGDGASRREQRRAPSGQATETSQGRERSPTGGRGGERSREGGVPDARDALVRSLVRFSEQAAATDDPRRAKDSLAAAREAAETLSALDR